MRTTKRKILKELANAVATMDEARSADLAREALKAGIDPYEVLVDGLCKGMILVGQRYEQGEYFVPELLLCTDAMYAGIDVLRPHLNCESVGTSGKVVIGVVRDDIHDIGKNLVTIMLEAFGFEVRDLGRDVPLRDFITEAIKLDAHMICMSVLMSTAMRGMEEIIRMLKAEGVRKNFKVLVGGGPVSQAFATRIGADGYAPNAVAAARKATQLRRTSR